MALSASDCQIATAGRSERRQDRSLSTGRLVHRPANQGVGTAAAQTYGAGMHPPAPLRRLQLFSLRHRRSIAALLTAVAALAGFRAVTTPPRPLTPVLVAAQDLPAGAVVGDTDLEEVGFAPGSVPAGVVDSRTADGRVLAAPVRAGEPLTDARLVQPSLLVGYPGRVAVPVRLGDAATATLLRTGDRVDLLASSSDAPQARIVASSASVIAVRGVETSRLDEPGVGGALVLVAVTPAQMPAVVYASASSFVSVVLRQ